MDQKIKIESFESDCLDEHSIKVESFYEPKLEIDESALLEDPLNVSSNAQGPFSYEIKTEIKSEINDVCENCSEIVIKTEEDSLVINPISIIPGADKPFQCDQCNKQYSRKDNLKQHIDTVHEGKKSVFACDHCNKQYSQKGHLNQHIASVHDGKKFDCDQCNKQFYYKTHLNRHIASVHDGKKSECDQCNKQFLDKGNLKRHISAVHDGKALKTKQDSMVKHSVGYERKSIDFNVQQKVNKNKLKNNPLKIKFKEHIEAVHEGTIPKPYQCQICDSKFRFPSLLKRHIRSVHEGKRPFHCNLCISAFYEKTKLKEHIEAVHEGTIPKPYQCQMCDSKFRFPSLLNRHIAQIHDGEKGDKTDLQPTQVPINVSYFSLSENSYIFVLLL